MLYKWRFIAHKYKDYEKSQKRCKEKLIIVLRIHKFIFEYIKFITVNAFFEFYKIPKWTISMKRMYYYNTISFKASKVADSKCRYFSIFQMALLETNILREAAKKKSSTNGRAIKALPPPPLELNGHRDFFLFFSLKISENGCWQLFFSPKFLD